MQSVISLTFDDGLRCQFEKAIPILDGYGIPATFFLIANRDLTHDRWLGHIDDWWKIDWRADDIATLKKLIKDGHEIGSHSVTHHPSTMQSDPRAEACASKELIESWLETNVTSFCYPFYSSHSYLADAVKTAGYEQARGGGTPPIYSPRASYYDVSGDPSFDRFNVDCRQISNNEKVSSWVQPGRRHILTFDAIGSQGDGWAPISVEQFGTLMAELAKYRDDGDVEILTFKNAVARLQ